MMNHETPVSEPIDDIDSSSGFSAKYSGGKVKHRFSLDKGQRYHVCNICKKSFSRRGHLQNHFLSHSGEKPHVCNVCSKSFTEKGSLKKHLLTHSGEKPYACNICDKSFNQNGNLKKHLLTHSGERPHVCNICNKSFRNKSNLDRHLLIHGRNNDITNCASNREKELPSTSKEIKNINFNSHSADTIENSHENNDTGNLKEIEEIYFIVKEEDDVSNEENRGLGDEKLNNSDVDLPEISCDIKEEIIHQEVNDIVKEYDIDRDGINY